MNLLFVRKRNCLKWQRQMVQIWKAPSFAGREDRKAWQMSQNVTPKLWPWSQLYEKDINHCFYYPDGAIGKLNLRGKATRPERTINYSMHKIERISFWHQFLGHFFAFLGPAWFPFLPDWHFVLGHFLLILCFVCYPFWPGVSFFLPLLINFWCCLAPFC